MPNDATTTTLPSPRVFISGRTHRPMQIATLQAIPVRLRRDRDRAQRTAGSPTALAGTSDYRLSPTVGCLYSIHFETAIVKITTTDGLVGWGEAQAPLAPEVACAIIDRLLRPVIEGAQFDPTPAGIAQLWDLMYATMRVRGQSGGFMLDAISGVDIALWDLAAKSASLPVAQLINPAAPRTVPAYLSGVSGATPQEQAKTAQRYQSQGFQTFKIFHGAETQDLFDTLDALRHALQPGTRLAVDALWRLGTESAPAFVEELDRREILWLEAPLPPEDSDAHHELAHTTRTPLAIGESYRTARELAPFVQSNTIRYLQPDLGRTGITEGLRIAQLARDHHIQIAPHVSIALGPQIAAAIHFAAALNCDLLEHNPSVFEVANRYSATPLRVENAKYIVPSGPGLGADILFDQLLADLHKEN